MFTSGALGVLGLARSAASRIGLLPKWSPEPRQPEAKTSTKPNLTAGETLKMENYGRYEILQEVTAFYAFDNFSSAEMPLPLVIFEYDKKAGKYLPANHLFQEYKLKGIESEIGNLSSDESGYLSKRLDLALKTFMQEKNRKHGHSLREYKRADKEKVQSKVKSILKEHPVYRFINRKRAT